MGRERVAAVEAGVMRHQLRGMGISARDAGLSAAANLAACGHASVEPVTLISGDVVAAICADCLRELPMSWLPIAQGHH